MAMYHVGWMHRDVSANNCLLSRDPADGPSLILDMELATRIDRQAIASKTAIPVSGYGSTNEIFAYHKSQGTTQFMARELLGSLIDQEDSDFVHLPQYDFESLVYVLACAVMKKECIIKPAKNSATKLAEMKKLYHQAFGHGTIHMLEHARHNFLKTWGRYQLVVAGEEAPSALHEIVLALLIQVNNQYISQVTSTLDEDDNGVPQAVPMNGKRMRKVFKRAIVRHKASLKDTSPDSDVDANYD
jgi:serine/threonine protein kinase